MTPPAFTPLRSAPAGQSAPQRAESPPSHERRFAAPRRGLYISVGWKLVIALAGMAAWVSFGVYMSQPWLNDLEQELGPVAAIVIVSLVAYIPGAVVSFMATALLVDRQPPLTIDDPTEPVTIIVAARNEEEGMAVTIERIARQDYGGPVRVIVADNGSTDRTAEIARATATAEGVELDVIFEERPGKAIALNTALESVTTRLVATVDADTLLHEQALRRLVSRMVSGPLGTVAVAGSVLVRNSRENLLAKMQEWDYFAGIAGVKRMQGLFQSTLVAQGAFSVYETEAVRLIGGWPDAIGEDIVVTWRLMEGGRQVLYEPTAVAFTSVPTGVRQFVRQRSRWARGMFEGLRTVPPWRQTSGLAKIIAGIDLLIPFLDVGYVFVWLPGLILFVCFGNTLIVSIWTLIVLPVTLVVYGLLWRWQSKHVFRPLGLEVRRNLLGYAAFLLGYQILASSASLVGYAQFATRTRRSWK